VYFILPILMVKFRLFATIVIPQMQSTRRCFIKQIGLGSLGLAAISILPYSTLAGDWGKETLSRSTPEQQGVSSAAISAFLDEVAKSKIDFHSIMVVRHGNVIAEGWWSPYARHLKHTLYSLSKSFTSTAVGLAIDEGHFNIDSTVLSFFPEERPKEVSPNVAAMKVRHLLTMSTGHIKDTIQPMRNSSHTWARTFFAEPVEKEPGTFFLYNTGATYMLSAIIQKVTGETLLRYLKPRLFDPLGIRDLDWESDPQGINTGGYGLRIKTEDIAKFGQLYLQKGKWKGKQVISSQWIEEATRTQINSNSSKPSRPKHEDDWAQGYGYQFWRCRPGGYRADGAFGQFCMVMPEYDAVIAITSESFSMQNSMDLIWQHLLPAMNKSASTLPPRPSSQADLLEKLGQLNLQPPQLNATSSIAERISGKEFILEKNEFDAKSIQLMFKENVCAVYIAQTNGKHEVTCGINRWVEQDNEKKGVPFPLSGSGNIASPIAASATWSDNNTLTMTMRLLEGAHANGLTFSFHDNNVTIKFHSSISLSNPNAVDKRADIKGFYVA
jgi:CubicO group peptidase (beta-lactamase class C family)